MENSSSIPNANAKGNNEPQMKNSRLDELHESLIFIHNTRSKIKTEAKSELPTINSNPNMSNGPRMVKHFSSLKDNKHLRYLFHEFCKQSYVGGVNATFDQMAKSADMMTLNKWMVFCKEFDLTKKLSSREMRLIFRKATKEGP